MLTQIARHILNITSNFAGIVWPFVTNALGKRTKFG